MQKERKITDNLACRTGCAAYLLERNAGREKKSESKTDPCDG